MKNIRKICQLTLIGLFCLMLISCEESHDVAFPQNALPQIATLKYELVCRGPKRNQSMMLTCWDNKILIYGSFDLMLFDTTTKKWAEKHIPMGDWTRRWDGALAKAGDYIFAFGSGEFLDTMHHKATKLNLKTMEAVLLPIPLPFKYGDLYPAYATINNNLIIIPRHADSVYLFNTKTETGKFITRNPLKITAAEERSDYTYNWGVNKNFLYVYKNSTVEFMRLDLTNFNWQTIAIPQDVKKILPPYINAKGGVFDELLLLFKDSSFQAVCYDFKTEQWGRANYDLKGDIWSEHSCKTEKELFILDYFPVNVWRIIRKR